MKRTLKINVVIALAVSLLTLTACGSGDDNSQSTATTVTATRQPPADINIVTPAGTESATDTQTEMITDYLAPASSGNSSQTDAAGTDISASDPSAPTLVFNQSINREDTEKKTAQTVLSSFPFLTKDGYVKQTSAQITESINTSKKYIVEDLTNENVAARDESDTPVMFCVEIKDIPDAQTDDGNYVIKTDINGAAYTIMLGDEMTSTIKEASRYAPKDSSVRYYGTISQNGYRYIFCPMLAGSDENGYYAVKTVFESKGYDMTDMPELPKDAVIGTKSDN